MNSFLRRLIDIHSSCIHCMSAGGVLIALFVVSAHAGTIFDEDWFPPKPVVKAHIEPTMPPDAAPASAPVATQPGDTPVPEIKPPSDMPQSDSPAEATAHVRRAIPAASEQARSRGLLKSAFAVQLKDRSAAGRQKLVKALLDEVPKTADNPSDEYVLLGGAIEASKEAGDLSSCFQAADTMAADYEVDGLNVKIEAAAKANFHGDSSAGNIRAVLGVVDAAAAAEDFAVALRLLSLARPASASDPNLSVAVQQRIRSIEALRATHERMIAAVEKLKAMPDDPAANQTLGSYFCFTKGEWEKGLPLLVKGSDAALKRVAGEELARPAKPEQIIALGDGWWDVAPHQSETTRPELLSHAAIFYKSALSDVTGLQRTILEKRIADASAAIDKQTSGLGSAHGRVIHLLPLIDPAKDTVQGTFEFKNGELVAVGQGQQRIEIPYHPPNEYDFRIQFTRETGNDVIIQMMNEDKIPFIWVMQENCIFHYLKSGDAFSNKTR